MKKYISAILGLYLLATIPVYAHGPTRQQVEESVVIKVSPDKAWELVGDFSGLHKWHPAIKSTEMKGDDVRILTLAPDKKITEKLLKRDVEKRKLKYKITDMSITETFEFAGSKVERKVLPVNTYTGFLTVTAEGEGSKVTWKGKFYRAYMLNPPTPEGMSDEDAKKTMAAVYQAGLDNLKDILEKGSVSSTTSDVVTSKFAAKEEEVRKLGLEVKAKGEALKMPPTPVTPEAPKPPAGVVVGDKETVKTDFDPKDPYQSHVKCEEGKPCKIDNFLIKGFRTFSQCQVCHGMDGNGSTFAPSLLDKLKDDLDYDLFVDRVANGFTGQIGVMPEWKNNPNIMKKMNNLYAYLKARADGVIPAGRLKKFKH